MKSRGYRLSVTEEAEDGSWTIVAPDLPGMVAAGRSLAAAARRLPDAIDSWIQGAEESGMPVPPPSRAEDDYSGRFVLRVAKSLHRRLADGAQAEGISLNSYCTTLLAGAVEVRQRSFMWDSGHQQAQGRYLVDNVEIKFESRTVPMTTAGEHRVFYGGGRAFLMTPHTASADIEAEGRDLYALPS